MARNTLPLICLAGALIASGGFAFARSDQPDEGGDRDDRRGQAERTMGDGQRDGSRDGRGGEDKSNRKRRPPPPPPTDAEWERTRAFLGDYAPARLRFFERFASFNANRASDDDPEAAGRAARMLGRVRGHIHEQVSDLQRLEASDPEMFNFALDAFVAEDRVFAAVAELRSVDDDDDEARAEAEATLDRAADEMVRASFAERQARIDRMTADLEEQRGRLAADRMRADEISDKLRDRYARMVPRKRPTTRPDDDPTTQSKP